MVQSDDEIKAIREALKSQTEEELPEGLSKIWKAKSDKQFKVSIPREIGRHFEEEFSKGAYLQFKVINTGTPHLPIYSLQVEYTTRAPAKKRK